MEGAAHPAYLWTRNPGRPRTDHAHTVRGRRVQSLHEGNRDHFLVATTVEGARAALVTARQIANEDPIPLVVPSPITTSVEATSRLVARIRDVAREAGEPVQVRVCLCRTPMDAARQLIPHDATVVVRGP